MTDPFQIRWINQQTATADGPGLLTLIQGLARFEGWLPAVNVDAAELARRLSLPNPPFRAVVAEIQEGTDTRLIGMATLLLTTYSFAQRPSLELEMLFVEKAWRSHGVGAAIMKAIIDVAQSDGYERLEWNVLKTNARAKAFYSQMGGQEQVQWERWRRTF